MEILENSKIVKETIILKIIRIIVVNTQKNPTHLTNLFKKKYPIYLQYLIFKSSHTYC